MNKTTRTRKNAVAHMGCGRTALACLMVPAMLAGLAGTSAMAGSYSKSYPLSFGDNTAGATATFTISAENRARYARTGADATGDVKLLGQTGRLGEFSAGLENANGNRRATMQLKVAGYIVDSKSMPTTWTWDRSINRTFLSVTQNFMVGPVPVTVRGSVGAGASGALTLALGPTDVLLSGSASAWGNGSASAGVGVSGANVSLGADLRLLKTGLYNRLQVTPTNFTGRSDLTIDPASVDFYVVARLLWNQWRKDLARFSAPSKQIVLASF
ncbi:MAG: hypothetical protein N2689_13000 [Verrucomicrobiae bacterium]|nr:hypothetical protein [Verrucomicrobiae bacterium]